MIMSLDNQNDVFAALQYYYPDGFEDFDPAEPSPTNYSEYKKWCKVTPLSKAEMIFGANEIIKKRESLQLVAEKRSELKLKWDSLPDFIRGPFYEKFRAVNEMLDAKDYDAAVALMRYVSHPSAYSEEEITIFNQVRQELTLALTDLKDSAI
jgi:hypothetical protein